MGRAAEPQRENLEGKREVKGPEGGAMEHGGKADDTVTFALGRPGCHLESLHRAVGARHSTSLLKTRWFLPSGALALHRHSPCVWRDPGVGARRRRAHRPADPGPEPYGAGGAARLAVAPDIRRVEVFDAPGRLTVLYDGVLDPGARTFRLPAGGVPGAYRGRPRPRLLRRSDAGAHRRPLSARRRHQIRTRFSRVR